MNEEKCCTVTCDLPLDSRYWDNQYQAKKTGWDLGKVSPALKNYSDTIGNKAASILIPGCGNSYEAEYLLEQGFSNVTVIDIAPTLVGHLKQKFEGNKNITVLLSDFFEHEGQYDYILEQTFFCALPPRMRQRYVGKMHQLLSDKGMLSGLLFDREFVEGPPFGGSMEEYARLFRTAFDFHQMQRTGDSVMARANTELFIELQKNAAVEVALYTFEGITCSGCMNTVSERFMELESVLNVSMNIDFSELIIVSEHPVEVQKLQEIISYEEKYKIRQVNWNIN